VPPSPGPVSYAYEDRERRSRRNPDGLVLLVATREFTTKISGIIGRDSRVYDKNRMACNSAIVENIVVSLYDYEKVNNDRLRNEKSFRESKI